MLKRQWYRPFLDLVYPRTCSLCSSIVVDPDLESICRPCLSGIEPTEHRCVRCSAPLIANRLGQPASAQGCRFCEGRAWSFRRAYCYTAYSGLAIPLTRRIKEPRFESLAWQIGDILGDWLCHQSADSKAYDAIVPIPQHWVRRISVRYNHSEVLAERVGRIMDLPVKSNWLFRTRWTKKQGTMSIVERLVNVENSFGCRADPRLRKKRLLLVDDVMTSGATLHHAAYSLRAAGAGEIHVLTFARGVGAFKKNSAETKRILSESVDD